jgi:predicted nucleic acid-binding protein
MNGRTFVDTNVLIYAHDADAKSKHATAKNILREPWTTRAGVLSMQVLQEFYVNVSPAKGVGPPGGQQLLHLVRGNHSRRAFPGIPL